MVEELTCRVLYAKYYTHTSIAVVWSFTHNWLQLLTTHCCVLCSVYATHSQCFKEGSKRKHLNRFVCNRDLVFVTGFHFFATHLKFELRASALWTIWDPPLCLRKVKLLFAEAAELSHRDLKRFHIIWWFQGKLLGNKKRVLIAVPYITVCVPGSCIMLLFRAMESYLLTYFLTTSLTSSWVLWAKYSIDNRFMRSRKVLCWTLECQMAFVFVTFFIC